MNKCTHTCRLGFIEVVFFRTDKADNEWVQDGITSMAFLFFVLCVDVSDLVYPFLERNISSSTTTQEGPQLAGKDVI